MITNEEHPEYDHVKAKAKQWFGMELMDDNFEKCRDLVRSVELDKNGKARSRQVIRRIVRGMK